MNNQMTINMENLSEEERETLMKLIEKANQTKREPWKPLKGEQFYYITAFGCVNSSTWNSSNVLQMLYKVRNYFKTKEEAEFEVEKLKIIVELKRFAETYNDEDFEKKKYEISTIKHQIFYDCSSNKISVSDWRIVFNEGIMFSSKELAEQAINEIGEDRIKKYLFNINTK